MPSLRKLKKLHEEKQKKVKQEELKLSKTLAGLNHPLAGKHCRGQKYGDVVLNLAQGRYNGEPLAGLTLGAVVALSRSLTVTDSLLVLSYSHILEENTPSLNSRFEQFNLGHCTDFFEALSEREDSQVEPGDRLSMRLFSEVVVAVCESRKISLKNFLKSVEDNANKNTPPFVNKTDQHADTYLSSSHETPAENGQLPAGVADEPSTRSPAVPGCPVDLMPCHEAAAHNQLDSSCDSDSNARKRKRVEQPVEADANQQSKKLNSFDVRPTEPCMPSLGNLGYNPFPPSAQPLLHYEAPVSTAFPTLAPSQTCLSQVSSQYQPRTAQNDDKGVVEVASSSRAKTSVVTIQHSHIFSHPLSDSKANNTTGSTLIPENSSVSVLCNPPPQPASRVADRFDNQQPGYLQSPRSSPQELTVIFESLSLQHQDVLRLLFYAGCSAPESLFTGTCTQWDTTGNIHAFRHGIFKQLDDGGEKILRDLETKRLVWSTKDCNRIYHINPAVVPALEQQMGNEIHWKTWVVNTVIHTFPTDRYKDPTKFTVNGKAMLRCFNQALIYLHEGVTTHYKTLLAEVCLSASRFGSRGFKEFVVTMARDLAEELEDHEISVRVRLRIHTLGRLYERSPMTLDTEMAWQPSNRRQSALFGEVLLAQAVTLMHQGRGTSQIHPLLERFRPSIPLSALENYILIEFEILKAKLLRHEGRFKEAETTLEKLFNTTTPSIQRVSSQYAEILCELRETSKAIAFIRLEHITLGLPESSSGGKRILLSLANAHLMSALGRYRRDNVLDTTALSLAETIFMKLCDSTAMSLVSKRSLFQISASLGMIFLLRSQLSEASDWWDRALDVSRSFPGKHALMLNLFAQSEISYRRGEDESLDLRLESERLFESIGRDYHFVGQGTLWLEVLRNRRQGVSLSNSP